MILDNQLTFADAQLITATAISEHTYDRGKATADVVAGVDLFAVLRVIVALDALTSLDVAIVSDSTANLATSPTTHCTRNFLLAALTANSIHVIGKLGAIGDVPSEQYLGGTFTINGADATVGSVDLFLVADIDQAWPRY